MIVWAVVVGALLGWAMAGFDGDALWPGGMAGAALGFWLRAIVRKEVAKGRDTLRAEMLALFEQHRGAVDAEPAAPPAAVPDPAEPSPWAGERVAETAPPSPLPMVDASVPISAPPPPAGPNRVERLVAAALGWALGGNTIVRAGLVILFVGLSFLAHYAANAGLFPIELRLALVAAAGIALLGVGFARRLAKPEFALTLQGGGVAILYLTIFAASRLFDVIPAAAAFPVMILVCALGCALALLQNAQVLAATSFAGGFAVPILLGGEGGGVGLFGYYTVLNLAVLAIAWRRSWRMVTLIGFVATFGLATLWGVLVYDPALYGLSQFFLILFVLIYVAAGLLQARGVPGRPGGVVNSGLLFGPALAGFGLQAGLVRHWPLGGAFSALGFGALYLALAAFVIRRRRGGDRVLEDGLLAIAVGFVTLAVPLALGVRWTATVWALEGAGALWVGMRQARWLPRAFGLLLQAAGALIFLAGLRGNVSALPLLGPNTLGALLIALPGFATAWWLRVPPPPGGTPLARAYARIERGLSGPTFLYAFAFWCLACVLEVNRLLPPPIAGEVARYVIGDDLRGPVLLLALVAGAALSALAGRRLGWAVALWPGRVTLVALVVALLARRGAGSFILCTPNWLFWAAAVALHYRLLWRDDRAAAPAPAWLRRANHIGSAWLMAATGADILWFAIDRGGLWRTSWAGVVSLVGATAALLVLTLWAGRANRPAADAPRRWPLAGHAVDYYWYAALPIAVLTYAGAATTALLASGRTDPLPYVPLLNPVDLAVALATAALILWRRTILAAVPPPPGAAQLAGPPPLIALAALGFVAINSVWLRIAHHLLGIGWSGPALFGSVVVQAGLSILWTLLALALTLTAHRRGLRPMWLAGAGLLAGVVVKLLLVDLSNVDGAARIVAFIVVGVLMLVVGYFAPLPPRADGGKGAAA